MSKTITEEQKLSKKIYALNLLKDYKHTPKNVILVNVQDIIEIFYELKPYTMSRLDDVEAREIALEYKRLELIEKLGLS